MVPARLSPHFPRIFVVCPRIFVPVCPRIFVPAFSRPLQRTRRALRPLCWRSSEIINLGHPPRAGLLHAVPSGL